MTKRLAIVVNDPDFFLSHRLPIALGAVNEGYDVYIVTAGGPSVKKITNAGLKHIAIPLSRRGMNPIQEFSTMVALYRIFKKIKPDIVHLVTIKPVIYGCFAAKWAEVPAVVAAVSGLGSTFIASGRKARLIRWFIKKLYKAAFSIKNIKVIFQNPSDRELLVNMEIIPASKSTLIRGSGVDLAQYTFVDEPSAPTYVSMASRLMKDKGVYEFVEAARKIKKNRDVVFQLIGKIDYNNPSAISKHEVENWQREGVVTVLGYRTDIHDLFSQSQLVVLPSYREGLPKVLVEAAACGRAVVTTDVPGCRDAIIASKTGLLVPAMNSELLAEKIEFLLTNSEIRKEMGRAGRALAETEFDIKNIVRQHLEIYKEMQVGRKEIFLITTSLLVVKFFLLPIIDKLQSKFNVTLLVNIDDPDFLKRMDLKIDVLHVPLKRKLSILSDLKAMLVLVWIFQKHKPDVVHTVAPKAGLLGIVAAWLTRMPVRLHTFQGEVWTTRKGIWRRFLKSLDSMVGRLSTHLLVVSKSERRFLISENVIRPEKSEVLGSGSICGVNLERFKPDPGYRANIRQKFGLSSHDKVILYVGRLNLDKGILDLIRAFNILLEHVNEKPHLVIVGPDEENIFENSQSLIGNNSKYVHFESYTDFPEQYMAASDVLVLPSYREGFGLVIMEAAAAKVPSIGSNVYGIADAIVNEETGLLFEPGNIVDLADKMKKLISDSQLYKRLSVVAYHRCALEFSQDKVVDATLRYYEKILA